MIKPPGNYQQFYDWLASEDIKSDIVPVYYKNAQRDRLIKLCGNTEGKMVLEIGIGKDPLICHLQGCSCRVAVDIAQEYLDRLPPDITAWHGFAEEMPYRDTFDLIICSDVLEHILEPERLLSAIYKALRSGGRAVIKTPYKENLDQYIGTKWEGCHLRTFDEIALERVIIRAGLMPAGFYYNGFSLSHHISPLFMQYVYYALTKTKLRNRAERIVCRLPHWAAAAMGFQPLEISIVVRKR